jgi:MFS family permease
MARRRVFADITPLRVSREFRLIFAGQIVSFIGSQITVVAVAIQVYKQTNSSFAVGLVSLASLPLLLAGSLVGGALADAFDRRRLLLVTQVLLGGCSVALALNAGQRHPHLWPFFVVTAVAAGFSGIDAPTRNAVVPNILPKELLPSAFALWQVLWQVGLVVGPAVAGVIIAHSGVSTAFWIDAASYAVALTAVILLPAMPPQGGGTKASVGSVVEGFRYLRSNRLLQSTFVIDLDAMIFGMPRALFPAIGLRFFGGGAATVGYLYAAPGAGALLGAVLSGWVSHVRRQGRAVLVAVAAWGFAIAAFGLARWLPLALLFLAVAGAADVFSAVFRNTILQLAVPDSLRGRLSAIHIAVVTGGPRLGDVEAGGVAALTDARFSVVSGGLACVVGAGLVAWRWKELSRHDGRTEGAEPQPRPHPEGATGPVPLQDG